MIHHSLEKSHYKECLELLTIIKKTETNLIGNYNDYLNKCFKYLDTTEEYNKKDFTLKLQNIYNENKYNFHLKENTIKNIIGRWKNNSLKFTKYNSIENRYNKIMNCSYGNMIIFLYIPAIKKTLFQVNISYGLQAKLYQELD